MSWAVWLSIPVVVTVIAAAWAWWRARPARRLNTAESMQAHSQYLDALSETARAMPHPDEKHRPG